MERWSGKVAVVTGASSGIGAAVAVALADAGLQVVGLARRSHLVDELKLKVNGDGTLHSRKCDISNLEDLGSTLRWVEETVGGIDVMVNNAGVMFNKFISEFGEPSLSDEEVSALIDTNYRATVMCSRHALASMKRRDSAGHIVNINSIAGHYVPWSPLFNIYASTKYAVTAFTEALLNEVGHRHASVRATSISPGLVATELSLNDTPEAQRLPALQPRDIADAVLYALAAPPHVNIAELTIKPVAELRL